MQQIKKSQLQKQWADLWLNSSDIECVVLHHTGISKTQYFKVDILDNFQEILWDFQRISLWEPIQYVLHSCEFYGRDFYVDTNVLIPRIDTEIMIDAIISHWYSPDAQFLDVGTGSGIIALTLALELENYKKISACDISLDALRVAEKNRDTLWLKTQVSLFSSDLLSWFWEMGFHNTSPLVITANLPYIKKWDYKNMSESTVAYEPDLALYGWGETGFEMYEKLIAQCKKLSKNWFVIELWIEIGFDQYEISQHFLREHWLDFEFFKDSATIERIVRIYGF